MVNFRFQTAWGQPSSSPYGVTVGHTRAVFWLADTSASWCVWECQLPVSDGPGTTNFLPVMCQGRVALGLRSDWLEHKTAWTSCGRPMKGDQSKLSLERPLSERPQDGCGWPVDVTGRPTDDFGRPMDVHLAPWTTTGRWSHYGRSKALCPSYVIWRYRLGSVLVQVMGWLPDGIKPLTDPMLTSWWRRQLETFSALLALFAGNCPVTGEFPAQRPVTQSFDVFFDLRLKKRFSKQWRHRWFETPLRSLWCHCNDYQ